MNIGGTIRKIRKSEEMTLKQLSEKSGITPSFLSDLENGKRLPSIETLRNISIALNTPVHSLLADIPEGLDDSFQNNSEMIINTGSTETNSSIPITHEKFIIQAKALFMSDELSKEDKEAIFKDISDLYWAAKGYKNI
jgi:transcriptional regulator with XRE-family HTH domain